MAKCALPFCQEQASASTESFADLCSQHAVEARDFYSELHAQPELAELGEQDPGSDSTNSLHGPDIAKDIDAAREVKVAVKQEFGERATLPGIKNLETMKLSAPTIKEKLGESFFNWCKLGVPVSLTDPVSLTVEIVNFRGDVMKRSYRSTDLNVKLELTMAQRVNNLLYDLPVMMEEVADVVPVLKGQGKTRSVRHCRVTLSWWGTIKQTTMDKMIGFKPSVKVVPQVKPTLN